VVIIFALGFVMALTLWMVFLAALAWSWKKHLASEAPPTEPGYAFPTRREAMWLNIKRHSFGWTLFFLLLFLLMAQMQFPFWQRLLFAGILATYYGSIRAGWWERRQRAQFPLFGHRRGEAWYLSLAIGEWFGYLGLLVFVSQCLVSAFQGLV
jgi:hypothetical protein